MFTFTSLISELLFPSQSILFVLLACLPILIFTIVIYLTVILFEHFKLNWLHIRMVLKNAIWVLTLISVLTPAVAHFTTLYRVNSAKKYLEKVIPFLTKHKAEHGIFPLSIESLELPVDPPPYLVRNHLGFSNCTIPNNDPSDARWYCSLNNGEDFELSFGYEDGIDERPSYHRESSNTWECEGRGCITDHR